MYCMSDLLHYGWAGGRIERAIRPVAGSMDECTWKRVAASSEHECVTSAPSQAHSHSFICQARPIVGPQSYPFGIL